MAAVCQIGPGRHEPVPRSPGQSGRPTRRSQPSPAAILQVDVARIGGTVCLRLQGELDLSSADEVRAAMTRAAAPSVIIDLTGCTFMDAAGLGALLELRRAAQARGGDVHFEGARGMVRRVFEVVGLDGMLLG